MFFNNSIIDHNKNQIKIHIYLNIKENWQCIINKKKNLTLLYVF